MHWSSDAHPRQFRDLASRVTAGQRPVVWPHFNEPADVPAEFVEFLFRVRTFHKLPCQSMKRMGLTTHALRFSHIGFTSLKHVEIQSFHGEFKKYEKPGNLTQLLFLFVSGHLEKTDRN